MDVVWPGDAKQVTRYAREQHTEREEVSQVYPLCYKSTAQKVKKKKYYSRMYLHVVQQGDKFICVTLPEKHSYSVREQKRRVQHAEQCWRILCVYKEEERRDYSHIL